MATRIWRNWKKWRKIRAKILERDKYQCQYCNVTLEDLAKRYGRKQRLLIVHHIQPEHLSDNKINEKENLVTLCYTCHYNAAIIGSDIYNVLQRLKEKNLAIHKNQILSQPDQLTNLPINRVLIQSITKAW